MSPDVAKAIPPLRARGILTDEREARTFLRVARGELVSVHDELRLLLYAGVLLITAGVGFLVRENVDRLGPVGIAFGIGIAAAASFVFVGKTAAPFTWSEAPSTHVAFDYVLLLGVLLASADLAYLEARFTPLGPNWPWHLLIASLAMAALAIRFDSRILFSLALSTFAAWRGVSGSMVGYDIWPSFGAATRWNALGCGGVFVLLGVLFARKRRKAHFEPIATYLGVALTLLALASGALGDEPEWSACTALLILAGAALAVYSLHFQRRFPLFAMGALALYVGASRVVVPWLEDEDGLVFTWFLLTSAGAIAALVAAHRTLEKAS
jgi:drug/metabolite transporter (DMT)-like permease